MYGDQCGEFQCRYWGLKGERLVYSGKCTLGYPASLQAHSSQILKKKIQNIHVT